MNARSIWRRLLFGCLLLGLSAGCATAVQEIPAPELTPNPTGMATDSIKPTATPLPLDDAIEVTFDGNECTVAGPTALPKGEYNFILRYPSEGRVDLWMSFLQDGKTYQDLRALQSEPGEYFQEPSWVLWDPRILRGWNESADGEVFTFMLNKVGEHVIYVGTYSPGAIWFCAPMVVTEA